MMAEQEVNVEELQRMVQDTTADNNNSSSDDEEGDKEMLKAAGKFK
jgi:hypothetical protein